MECHDGCYFKCIKVVRSATTPIQVVKKNEVWHGMWGAVISIFKYDNVFRQVRLGPTERPKSDLGLVRSYLPNNLLFDVQLL